MDSHTLELLEFEKLCALVAGYAASSLGKEAARAMHPSADAAEVRSELALTTEMAEALASGLAPPFGGLRDVRTIVRRAATGATLEGEELAEVADVLRAAGSLRQWLDRVGEQFPRLGGLAPDIFEFSAVIAAVESCLDARGRVLDTASRQLSQIRRDIDQAEQRIQETLARMLRSPELRRVLRYPNFTVVGHHYVLPVAREHRGEVPGAVLRTSATNETVFIEPQAVADQSAQLSFLRSREHKEVRRILRWLSAQVGQVADGILHTLAALARLDLVFARARYARDFEMSPPELNEDGRLALRAARHPLLESLFREEARGRSQPLFDGPEGDRPSGPLPEDAPEPRRVVPIDVHLGLDARLLVITGPNTGGKTVALKTVGLLAAMAQSGLHVPAAPGSRLPIVDTVLADIGDEQSLEQSLSTFSSHVRSLVRILGTATQRSLVLLDEMGAGTDPVEGAALGRAVLDELDAIGCLALVTTHIGELKSYALNNPRAQNAAVEFDVETLRPLYRLRIGEVGQSNALQIARRLNMPEHIVARAAGYLSPERRERDAEWALAQHARQEAEAARAAALAAEGEAERLRAALDQRLRDLQTQQENDARLAEARRRLQPGDRVVAPRLGYDRPGRVVKLDPRKQTALVAVGVMQWEIPVDELIPQLPRNPG